MVNQCERGGVHGSNEAMTWQLNFKAKTDRATTLYRFAAWPYLAQVIAQRSQQK
jgi:hypothetical protein